MFNLPKTTELTKTKSSALSIAQKCAEMVTKSNVYFSQINVKERKKIEEGILGKIETIELNLNISFLTLKKSERLALKSNAHKNYPSIKGRVVFEKSKNLTPKLAFVDLKITKDLSQGKTLFFIYFTKNTILNNFSDWLTEEEKGGFEEFVIHFLNDVF